MHLIGIVEQLQADQPYAFTPQIFLMLGKGEGWREGRGEERGVGRVGVVILDPTPGPDKRPLLLLIVRLLINMLDGKLCKWKIKGWKGGGGAAVLALTAEPLQAPLLFHIVSMSSSEYV